MAGMQQNGKLLDQFVEAMSTRDHVPTFILDLTEHYFKDENEKSLYRFWRSGCVNGLVKLNVVYPLVESSFTSMLPPASTPNLLSFTVTPCRAHLEHYHRHAHQETVETLALSHFINSVLSGANNLDKFELCITREQIYFQVPRSFKYLTFPTTISKLDLKCLLDSETLEALLGENSFRNLTHLSFVVSTVPFQDGLLFKVLDKVKVTLCSLTIHGVSHNGNRRNPSFIRFPKMEALTELVMDSIHCELERGHPPLETVLPKLQILRIYHQTLPMLLKWMEGSNLSGVKELHIFKVNDAFIPSDHGNYYESLDDQMIEKIRVNFSHISALYLQINIRDISGLRYLCWTMEELTELAVTVVYTPPSTNADIWDSLLTGIPEPIMAAAKRNPTSSQHDLLNSKSTRGIMDLKNLRKLCLWESDWIERRQPNFHPWISDIAWSLVRDQLPMLKVNLSKRFKPSRRMLEECE